MFRRIIFIIFTLCALGVILWSSNYIYHKQSKKLNPYSFSVSNSSSFLFIPNVNNFVKNNISINPSIIKNESVNHILDLSSQLKDYNFNKKISTKIVINFDGDNYSIILQNYNLTINDVVYFFKDVFNTEIEKNELFIRISDKKVYYQKVEDFLVLSNTIIDPKLNSKTIDERGNFDYSFESNINKKTVYYKHSKKHIYKFWISNNKEIKGRSINSKKHFKHIPVNFDTAFVYSSSRFIEDINHLLNTNDSSNFFTWVNESVIFLKKDSFELLLGEQNNELLLKNILDEQTLELSEDSLLPTPIFKSNYEIHFFKTKYDWSIILPHSTFGFNVYTEKNNYNILASSMQALEWYIKEIQLGNNYHIISKELPLPLKTNQITIINSGDYVRVKTKNWINKSSCFNSEIQTNKTFENKHQKIKLENTFFIPFDVKHINLSKLNDSLIIILSNKHHLKAYNQNAKQLWSIELKSPLVKAPQIINENNIQKIVLFCNNNLDIIDISNGKSFKNFPVNYTGISKGGLAIKYDKASGYRVLVNVNQSIKNYTTNGKTVKGWRFNDFSGTLKGDIRYQFINGKDYIYFKSSLDSVYVLNRRGEKRFNTIYKVNLKNESVFISGDITKGNLRCLGYNNNFILSQFLSDGHLDSLQIQTTIHPTSINWIQKNEKTYLVVEEFDRIYIMNEFGIIEQEIQKPKPNLSYLNSKIISKNLHFFWNLVNNDLYLLNEFGKQLNTIPLKGGSMTTIYSNMIVTFYNSNIYIYKLN
ncbi:MAG TPA: hypothetical protein EYG85_06270 [Crocinitomix sp.]|nr:hypothetical protein [Crocinitomix sp.]